MATEHWFIGWHPLCLDCSWEGWIHDSRNSAQAEKLDHQVHTGHERVFVGRTYEEDDPDSYE